MPEPPGFLKGHVHLWNSGNRVWHHLSCSMTVKEEQAAGTFVLLIPPDWGVRPKKAVLYSAAMLRCENWILPLYSVECQPSKLSEFLRVDYEPKILLQKESWGGNTGLCLFITPCGLGRRAVMMLQQGHTYMRQRFVSKVSVHTVLLSPALPLTTHAHSHLFNINSVV